MAYGGPTSAGLARVTATITGNAGSAFTTSFGAASTAVAGVASGSILDPAHGDPTVYDPANPFVTFVIQAIIIIALSRFLAYFLARIRQPRVISEVIAGIIIGPSAMGRIPGFTSHIFPPASIPGLNLVATVGLVLFLFLVGLEVDFSLFRRNLVPSSAISLMGLAIPFALGAAVSVGIYQNFVDESAVKFGTFLLFIGTANAITAFPVLARILTELELLQNHVGVIVLSAGVANDVLGWILLALAIALVNAASGIIVLYVLLTCIAWILALWFIGRPLLVIACRRSGSFGENGPTQGIVCAIVCLVLISSWITDKIGVHAIFGGFVVGLIVPKEIREGLTEKIEDLVSCLFLPLYFALSGLKTDLGLLSNGSIWGWTMCVIFVAFFGKFLSCGIAARVTGMDWRESGAVGSLMACKGLVELIVLNIGLNAGILNPAVFAMFVTMALVTTFVTTPLTLAFYPRSYRLEKERLKRALAIADGSTIVAQRFDDHKSTSRFAVVLERFEHLPALFTFSRLIKAPIDFSLDATTSRPGSISTSDEKVPSMSDMDHTPSQATISIDIIRLIELSQRPSALIKAAGDEEVLKAADPLNQIFRSYAAGNGIPTSSSLAIAPLDSFSGLVAGHAAEKESDMILLPWSLSSAKIDEGVAATYLPNPFESIFKTGSASREGSPQYATFVRRVFAEAACDVALFLDRGLDASSANPLNGRAHLFFTFHSGSDDRACLDFVVQLATRNPGITATVVRVLPTGSSTSEDSAALDKSDSTEIPAIFSQLTVQGGNATDTLYPAQNQLLSDTADNVAIAHWFGEALDSTRSVAVKAGLARIDYSTLSTSQPLHTSLARSLLVTSTKLNMPTIIIVGRGRRDAPSYTVELANYLKDNLDAVQGSIATSSEVRRSLGDLGVAYLVSGTGNSMLVVQSKGAGGVVKSKAN